MKKLVILLLSVVLCPALNAQSLELHRADSLFRRGQYQRAIDIASRVSQEAEQRCDLTTCMKAWCIIGEAYFASGNEDKARDFCCKCYVNVAKDKGVSTTPDIILLSSSLSSTSKIYKESGEYDEAIKYLNRSLVFDKALDRMGTVVLRYSELTDILISQGRYEEALACIDTAKTYIKNTSASSRIRSRQVFDTGLCKEALGDSLAAEKCFKEADEILHQWGSVDILSHPKYLLKLGSYAEARGDVDTAIRYYEEILATDTQNLIDMSDFYSACVALTKLYAGRDDDMSARYAARADSLDFYPELKALAANLALYNIDFPRKEREQAIRNQRLRLYLLGSLLLLLTLALLTLILRNKDLKKIARMREEQNESLRRANEQKDELLEISKSIVDEHVRDEVSRIASELGDTQNVKLTRRESEVAALIAEGLLNKEIASHLNISVRTVEFHRNAIYRKLGINNAVELMNYLNSLKQNT